MNSEPTAETSIEQTITYYGSHTRKVDAKGRFHLPFQFRAEKADEDDSALEEYMICPGPHGSWALAPRAVWLKNFQIRPDGQSKADYISNSRRMSRNSYLAVPDKQGRIAIPPLVKEPLGVDKEILIVGMGETMELWAPDRIDGGEAGAQTPSDDYLFEFFG